MTSLTNFACGVAELPARRSAKATDTGAWFVASSGTSVNPNVGLQDKLRGERVAIHIPLGKLVVDPDA